MYFSKIRVAKEEAMRFLSRVGQLEIVLHEEERIKNWPITGSKESAALRRASLDLSRALAEMRNL